MLANCFAFSSTFFPYGSSFPYLHRGVFLRRRLPPLKWGRSSGGAVCLNCGGSPALACVNSQRPMGAASLTFHLVNVTLSPQGTVRLGVGQDREDSLPCPWTYGILFAPQFRFCQTFFRQTFFREPSCSSLATRMPQGIFQVLCLLLTFWLRGPALFLLLRVSLSCFLALSIYFFKDKCISFGTFICFKAEGMFSVLASLTVMTRSPIMDYVRLCNPVKNISALCCQFRYYFASTFPIPFLSLLGCFDLFTLLGLFFFLLPFLHSIQRILFIR